MDTLTVAAGGKVSVPSGTIEIAPASSIAVHLGGAAGLSLSQSTLDAMNAGTLRLGGITVGGVVTPICQRDLDRRSDQPVRHRQHA